MEDREDALLSTSSACINFYILVIAFIVLATATTISNTLALVAFIKLRYYQKVSEFLLVLLSMVDLMTGLTTDGLMAARFILHLQGEPELSLKIRVLARLTGFNFSLMSVFTLVVVCYEMYLSLLKPFFPPRKVGKIFVYHLVFWFFLVLAVTLLNTDDQIWRIFRLSASVILIIAYSILCVTQFRILRETGRIAASGLPNHGELERRDVKMKQKSYKIARQILLAFGVSFIPYIIVMIFDMIWKEGRVTTNTFLRPWAFFFALTSSLVNPFLHSFRLKRVRNSLSSICQTGKVVSLDSHHSTSVTYLDTTSYHCKSHAIHLRKVLRHKTGIDHISSQYCNVKIERKKIQTTTIQN